MISFYDLSSTQYNVPTSRIEGLVGIPLCLEYYRWPENNNDSKLETLLVGDDLGICHMYTLSQKTGTYANTSLKVNTKLLKVGMFRQWNVTNI